MLFNYLPLILNKSNEFFAISGKSIAFNSPLKKALFNDHYASDSFGSVEFSAEFEANYQHKVPKAQPH